MEFVMQGERDTSMPVFYALTKPVRIVRIPAGCDPTTHPLLAHAGILLEEGHPATRYPHGLSGLSETPRKYITTVNNDMCTGGLVEIAGQLNDPDRYQGVPGDEATEAFFDEIDAVLNFEKTCGEIKFPD